MTHFPFTAVVGADDLELALILTTIDPAVGGVLIRGEKGTAKSTIVRALVDVLPPVTTVLGCRFGCDPARPDSTCPDGPHAASAPTGSRPARLVELPVGATDDRVVGSLDLGKALGEGAATFQPGLLADAHRGLLYVDEVNLLHDHLVDLLLDAAAMGRNTVERDGVSVSHASRFVLVGTMNPEEGELRPQLLDRFGLTVEVAASRDPLVRAEVVRRRLAFDTDPEAFTASYGESQRALVERLATAREHLATVTLPDWALSTIARVCAGFDVDGMRADLVTTRAALAHAAWRGAERVEREDIRAAARFALPHRRRRNPFDAPGLDEDLLDRLLDEEPEPDPEPPTAPEPPEGPDGGGEDERPEREDDGPAPQSSDRPQDRTDSGSARDASSQEQHDQTPTDSSTPQAPEDTHTPAPTGVAGALAPFRVRRLTVSGVGQGAAGRRSRAITGSGRTVGSSTARPGPVHLPATLVAAAPHQPARGRDIGRVRLVESDLRTAIRQGEESNLVLFAVDASGSMAAKLRMEAVKGAVLSLLLDAYQRRDRVGLVTFRGSSAELTLHPTSSVDAAARALSDLPHGGRTPLAEGLRTAARVLELERMRDRTRRALLVLVTDGRATAGPEALGRARAIADAWSRTGVQAVVVDCETGRFRMGLAADIAARMGADYLPLGELREGALVEAVTQARAGTSAIQTPRSVA